MAPLKGVTKIISAAGSGKTYSLVGIAKQNRHLRGLYIAFTKSAKLDAEARFPKYVSCQTVNGLAFKTTGQRYSHKLNPSGLKSFDVIKLMDLAWNWEFAGQVVDTLAAYCASDATEFPTTATSISHTPVGAPHLLQYAAVVASKLWERMQDVNDAAPMTHDGYLKLFQLQHPRLPVDYVMVDEFQDTNPVTLDIIRRQTCPVVIVGDGYQSIFQFRGSVNAMDLIQPDQTFTLSQSFRFGPRVARIANAVLWGFFGETMEIVGSGVDTVVRVLPSRAQRHAVIARTNAQIFDEAAQAVQMNRSLAFAGGIRSYNFDKIIDAWYLSVGQTEHMRDKFLLNFKSFAAFEDYAINANDMESRRIIKMVHTYGDSIVQLVVAIQTATMTDLDQADVVLSTAHRCKGLTLHTVVLAEDFPALTGAEGNLLPPEKLNRQEVNLLYVALTRASHWMQLNETTLSFLRAMAMPDVVLEHAKTGNEESAHPQCAVVQPKSLKAPSAWFSDLPPDEDGFTAVVETVDTSVARARVAQFDLFL